MYYSRYPLLISLHLSIPHLSTYFQQLNPHELSLQNLKLKWLYLPFRLSIIKHILLLFVILITYYDIKNIKNPSYQRGVKKPNGGIVCARN